MRPTGRLHLGHYFGALQNWLKLQQEYDCFFFVADWHALTTHYEDTSSIAENTLQVAIDWLSVGLDPAKSTLFIQSSVLEHAELHLLLAMITPLSWLERVPTYKEQIENLKDRDLGTYGFLGYPLLQTADIVMYGASHQDLLVPVGEDQVPHIELSREVVRRLNFFYGFHPKPLLFNPYDYKLLSGIYEAVGIRAPTPQPTATGHPLSGEQQGAVWSEFRKRALDIGLGNFCESLGKYRSYFEFRDLLAEPAAMLTETPRLPGLDGRRMAKSYGNAIWLSEAPEDIRTKARNMMTDPQRQRRTDPGRPEICPVFAWHKLFSPPETVGQVDRDCRTAAIGCVDCKKLMADNLTAWIEPIQVRREEFEAHPQQVWDILDEGATKARASARLTMRRVRNAIFKWDDARKPAGGI
jgi:tryptophanyl-tRNA synthetase